MWNKDEVKGKAETIKGKAKQAIADLDNNDRLRGEGEADEAAGRVQESFGKGRRKVGEAIENIGKTVKK